MALIHGGQLNKVALEYNIPVENWLDLSTGIAPLSYPIPAIKQSLWQQLPQESQALIKAAKNYYQCEKILVTNGSQSIIKALPDLWRQQNRNSKNVFLPNRGYKEHAQAWRKAGFTLCFYQDDLPAINDLSANDVLVIINPNNPTGKLFNRADILQYQQAIKEHKGLLIVDEAFIDVMPIEQSIAPYANNEHTIVLRSFGKFFGLAGIRIGFLISGDYWLAIFSEYLGPWQVNGPAQLIAEQALANTTWQQHQRMQLKLLRKDQEKLLWQAIGEDKIKEISGSDLFLTVKFNPRVTVKKIYHLLCKQGVYTRLADEEDTIRFGITSEENQRKLSDVLKNISAIT